MTIKNLVVVAVCALLSFRASADTDADYSKLLIEGDKLLAQGRSKYQEAVGKYTAAVQLKPEDKKALYRRAELYSLMKEYQACEEDVAKVLLVDPSHHQSIALRSKIRSGKGEFQEAASDEHLLVGIFEKLGNEKKANVARESEAKYRQIGHSWELVRKQLDEATTMEDRVKARAIYSQCVDVIHNMLPLVKDSAPLRMQRIVCAIESRRQQVASDELRFILKANPNNLEAIALNAKAMRMMDATDLAKKEVRRCLTLDPEFAPCQKLHRSFKKIQALQDGISAALKDKKYDQALDMIDKASKSEDANEETLLKFKCDAYVQKRDVTKGLASCEELIQFYGTEAPSSCNAYLSVADLHMMDSDMEKANIAVKKVAEICNGHEKLREYQGRISNFENNKGRKDYYALLEVPKTASEQEIRRSYRKLARLHHPDLYQKDITPKERERKDKLFRDLNEAKEMLLDEEKRRRYDNGEDVANPQKQQQQQGHFNFGSGFPGGFPGGGMPGGFNFGGGNFQFKFG